MIWKQSHTLSEMNQFCQGSAVSHLGIEFCHQDSHSLTAKLTLDQRTCQPFGLLHGGISAALAETVGSAASMLCCEENQIAVGSELSISHLKAIKQGEVLGKATPLHLGSSSHVWQIDIIDEQQRLCAAARLTMRVLDKV